MLSAGWPYLYEIQVSTVFVHEIRTDQGLGMDGSIIYRKIRWIHWKLTNVLSMGKLIGVEMNDYGIGRAKEEMNTRMLPVRQAYQEEFDVSVGRLFKNNRRRY